MRECLGPAARIRLDARRWPIKYTEKTRQLFHQAWFYDVDSRTRKPIVIPGHREITQVAPIMCGVATDEQTQAMIPAMLEYNPAAGLLAGMGVAGAALCGIHVGRRGSRPASGQRSV